MANKTNRGSWKKGQSGNPAGRPKGIKDWRIKYRKDFEEAAPGLIKKLIDMAKEGDTHAMKLCIERAIPAYKPTDVAVELANFDGSLSERGDAILRSMSEGELTPDQGGSLLRAIAEQAKITQLDELTQRMEALEKLIESRLGSEEK